LIANLSGGNFSLRLTTKALWNTQGILPELKEQIRTRVTQQNPQYWVTWINKYDPTQLRVIPALITSRPVEYMCVVNLTRRQIYLLYLTSDEIRAY